MPDQVLRQPAAPARPGASPPARAGEARAASATSRDHGGGQLVVGRAAAPPRRRNRPTDDAAPAARRRPRQVRPLRRRDGDALDQPAVDGRHEQPGPGGDVLAPGRPARPRPSTRTGCRRSGSDRAGRDARPAAGRPWPAGAATTTASASAAPGAAAGPTVELEAGRPSGAAPCAGVRSRTSAPEAATSAAGSEPRPPATVANTGPSASPRLRAPASRAAAAAASTEPPGAQLRGQRRHRRGQRQLVGPAGVDAAEQRLDQPVDHLVAEPLAHQRADRDVPVQRRSGGSVGLGPRPGATPAGAEHAGERRRPDGRHAEQVPAGSGCSAVGQRRRTAWVVAGATSSVGQPERLDQLDAPPARRASIASAPMSTSWPASSTRCSLPPTAVAGLEHDDLVVRAARGATRTAAARPAMPPPTTTERLIVSACSSCTSSTTRVSTSGSVSGSTPWPRLKMCPRAARPSRPRPGAPRASTTGQSASSTRRVEVALQRRGPAPTRRAASSSGTRQSTPTTSAPASPHQREQLAGADAEVDPRHVQVGQRRRTPRASAAARTARSRRADSAPAQESNSCTAAAPASIWTRRNVAAMTASRSSSACHSVGLAVHQRLGAGVLLDGPPSTR